MKTAFYLQKYLERRPLFLSLIRSKEAELYSRLLPLKSPVLDVGCGDGFFAKTVFEKLDVGLDLVDSRIKEAKAAGIYRKAVVYDGHKFPFPRKTFSTVISNCVFEHLPNLSEVLAEIYRVLNPGGEALVTVMAKPWEEQMLGTLILGNFYQSYMRKKQQHYHLLTHHQWEKAFGQAGFAVKEKIGYLAPLACRVFDLCHYLSLPSLVTYKLWGKWVLWSGVAAPCPQKWLARLFASDVAFPQAGALFFRLGKRR